MPELLRRGGRVLPPGLRHQPRVCQRRRRLQWSPLLHYANISAGNSAATPRAFASTYTAATLVHVHSDAYKQHSQIADWNNEGVGYNATYKENFIKVRTTHPGMIHQLIFFAEQR